MRVNTVLALTAVLLLGLTSTSYARYEGGFRIVEVKEGQVVLKKGKADPILVDVKKDKFNVGDMVKYDAKKLKILKPRIRKYIGGC